MSYEGLQNNPIEYLNSVTNLNFIDSNIPRPKVFPAVTQTLIDYKQYFTNYNELKLFVESWDLIKD